MTNLRRLLANTMKEQRRKLGLTQAKLAEKINTAPTYIAMIELEKKWPSDKMLTKIASALSIDTPQFFSMSSYPEDSLIRLHKSVLTEFQKVINKKLEDVRNI
ncbi:MAG: helix-turn-helix domain-containing protein [Clostridiales bacterium]|nr:helix-turn-helix domain-containing protein [Clostridiales bacterium]